MFSELRCNTELERRSSGSRRVCVCRRHNLRFDENGSDRRVGIGRRSSDERRTGSDRRINNKRIVSGSIRPRNLIEIS